MMKIRKPEDEKYFKDIVLNNILDEISHEQRLSPKTSHQKKSIFLRLLWLIGFFGFLLFTWMLWQVLDDATQSKAPTPKTATYTQEWHAPVKKPKKDTIVIDEKSVKAVKVVQKVLLPKPAPQKSERELAKEALRQQMLH